MYSKNNKKTIYPQQYLQTQEPGMNPNYAM